MSTVATKVTARGYIERALNEQRIDLFEEYIDENIIQHPVGRPTTVGRERMKAGVGMLFKAFPDFHLTIDDEIAEGDKVVVRYSFHGTHQGELAGIPGTGKEITLAGVAIYQVDNGKVVEFWNFPDELTLMRQLGVVPAQAPQQMVARASN
jgi:steroid delta-isomerase-like uncharacterized protein